MIGKTLSEIKDHSLTVRAFSLGAKLITNLIHVLREKDLKHWEENGHNLKYALTHGVVVPDEGTTEYQLRRFGLEGKEIPELLQGVLHKAFLHLSIRMDLLNGVKTNFPELLSDEMSKRVFEAICEDSSWAYTGITVETKKAFWKINALREHHKGWLHIGIDRLEDYYSNELEGNVVIIVKDKEVRVFESECLANLAEYPYVDCIFCLHYYEEGKGPLDTLNVVFSRFCAINPDGKNFLVGGKVLKAHDPR